MGDIRDNLQRNIGYYLTLIGMSQKDFSEKLGVSQSAVTNWIKGKNSPDIELVAKMCEIFGVSVLDLMGIKEKSPALSSEALDVARAYDRAPDKDRLVVRTVLGLPDASRAPRAPHIPDVEMIQRESEARKPLLCPPIPAKK